MVSNNNQSEEAPSGKKIDPYNQIRDDLEKQRSALLDEAGIMIGGSVSSRGEAFPDVSDQATAETNHNFTLRLREREQRLLKKVEEAIKRLSDGSYGICESCEEEIGLKRLIARPVTTLCIACKTEQEEKEKIGK